MSKASDYAALVTTRETLLGAPLPFVSSNVRAEVTGRGNLLLVLLSGNPEIPPDSALALRDWLTANFG